MAWIYSTLLLLSSLLFIPHAHCAEVKGALEWGELCPDATALGSARAVLDDGRRWYSSVHKDGSFVIRDVEEGRYVLSVLAHDHLFDQVLVSIATTNESSSTTIFPHIPGTPMSFSSVALPYPVRLLPRRKNQYYVAHEQFSVLAMFQNPMMLLMGFVGIMAFATPYLMKNMEPEAAKEPEDRRAAVTKIQSSIQNTDIGSGVGEVLGGRTSSSVDVKNTGAEKKAGNASSVKKSKSKKR